MFTGIVQAIGEIQRVEPRGGDSRLVIASAALEPGEMALGESIAVQGCCLTATAVDAGGFTADISNETRAATTLDGLRAGSLVNLERALTLATPLGGHLVSGHVDGVGELVSAEPDGRSERWRFAIPPELARYVAAKGSVCIDGVSLTVNTVGREEFAVNIVPHTQAVTTFGRLRPGARVNIEVDLVARYVERLLDGGAQPGGITPAP